MAADLMRADVEERARTLEGIKDAGPIPGFVVVAAEDDIALCRSWLALDAKREALERENAALRGVAADAVAIPWRNSDERDGWCDCRFCMASGPINRLSEVRHDDACPVARLAALAEKGA